MSNFFNAIGMADLEKVHSAMIAWILDDDNDPLKTSNSINGFITFSKQQRSRLLCELFGIPFTKEFNSIKTYTEWNDIDILIQTCDPDNYEEDIWVIENKLKSQEHKSNSDTGKEIWQTQKYRELIENNYPKKNNNHYMLLSLGGDKAKDVDGKWYSCSYSAFLASLRVNLNSDEEKYPLINEYSVCLSGILDALKGFLDSNSRYDEYPHVFNKLKKSNKDAKIITQKERFIVENGLETIFQKQLLAKLINENLGKIKDSVEFDERNGTAMFLQTVKVINDFKLIIEFQGGTYKVALHHLEYNTKASSQHTSRIYGKLDKDKWNGIVYHVFDEFTKNGWRIAVAKNLKKGIDKAKPRIALDRNIGKEWCDNDTTQFLTGYQEACELANSIASQLDRHFLDSTK